MTLRDEAVCVCVWVSFVRCFAGWKLCVCDAVMACRLEARDQRSTWRAGEAPRGDAALSRFLLFTASKCWQIHICNGGVDVRRLPERLTPLWSELNWTLGQRLRSHTFRLIWSKTNLKVPCYVHFQPFIFYPGLQQSSHTLLIILKHFWLLLKTLQICTMISVTVPLKKTPKRTSAQGAELEFSFLLCCFIKSIEVEKCRSSE